MKHVNEVVVAKAGEACDINDVQGIIDFALANITDFNAVIQCIIDAVLAFVNNLLGTDIQV
ncbi:MAG: hypothetical protein AAB353_06635 [Candidatus Hydrogenedentota bacterium]